jgi:Uncharacterized protein conserved in bacteria
MPRWRRCMAAASRRGGRLGLEWYAEHVADARAFPGKHPNIDRLLAWAQGTESYRAQPVAA